MKHIGLFGGSFDPIHQGHLLVAQAAFEEFNLDRLFFIPASQSPFKPGRQPTPAALRLAMVRLALAGKTWCEVDTQEISRGGISYTIDTLRDYRARFPESKLFYLIGADHVPTLPQWREALELGKMAEFLAIPRPGEAPRPFPPGFRGHLLKGFPLGISASEIRERVRAGKTIEGLVPPAVSEWIFNKRLYL